MPFREVINGSFEGFANPQLGMTGNSLDGAEGWGRVGLIEVLKRLVWEVG